MGLDFLEWPPPEITAPSSVSAQESWCFRKWVAAGQTGLVSSKGGSGVLIYIPASSPAPAFPSELLPMYHCFPSSTRKPPSTVNPHSSLKQAVWTGPQELVILGGLGSFAVPRDWHQQASLIRRRSGLENCGLESCIHRLEFACVMHLRLVEPIKVRDQWLYGNLYERALKTWMPKLFSFFSGNRHGEDVNAFQDQTPIPVRFGMQTQEFHICSHVSQISQASRICKYIMIVSIYF